MTILPALSYYLECGHNNIDRDGLLFIGDGGQALVTGQRAKWCRRCNHWKPERAHHCSVCGKCVLKMDHHCIWVVNCVGACNYKVIGF